MRTDTPAELRRIFERYEPLPERVERNRRRLRWYLIGYVTLSSLLIAIAAVLGPYVAFALLVLRWESHSPDVLGFLQWLTYRLPLIVLFVWGVTAALLASKCLQARSGRDDDLLMLLEAAPVGPGELPQAKAALHDVAIAAGGAPPRLAMLEDASVNAFLVAHTYSHGWIGVTRGMLDTLDQAELRAVFAHLVARLLDGSGRNATIMAEVFSFGSTVGAASDRLLDRIRERDGESPVVGLGKALISPLTLMIACTRVSLGIAAKAVLLGHRTSQLVTAEYADAMAMMFTRDPDGTMRALRAVLPADNRPGGVFEPRFNEHLYGSLFYAWPTLSDADDPELCRITRMREVLGASAA